MMKAHASTHSRNPATREHRPANRLPSSDETSCKYIEDSERQWAESVSTDNSEVLERILADDFAWILDGRKLTKADAKAGPGDFLSDHVDEISVRFYGKTAVAQAPKRGPETTPTIPKAASSGPIPGSAATASGRSSRQKTSSIPPNRRPETPPESCQAPKL